VTVNCILSIRFSARSLYVLFMPTPIQYHIRQIQGDTRNRRRNKEGNNDARSYNHFCRTKTICITYSECVSAALVIWHAKRMRRIIVSSVACLTLPYFSESSHKRHDFRKKLLNIKCVFRFSLQFLSETFLILKRIQPHTIINVGLHVKCRYSCDILTL
jgi:hypothetical protein